MVQQRRRVSFAPAGESAAFFFQSPHPLHCSPSCPSHSFSFSLPVLFHPGRTPTRRTACPWHQRRLYLPSPCSTFVPESFFFFTPLSLSFSLSLPPSLVAQPRAGGSPGQVPGEPAVWPSKEVLFSLGFLSSLDSPWLHHHTRALPLARSFDQFLAEAGCDSSFASESGLSPVALPNGMDDSLLDLSTSASTAGFSLSDLTGSSHSKVVLSVSLFSFSLSSLSLLSPACCAED